mmetsp:Transcript_39122/g.87831  ORF Transcript_39122/g.87831 Transcript_39122/m.87831 type:complete len:81 (+) Transcript_39122:515-757(+)
MESNLRELLMRGERLDQLRDRTAQLHEAGQGFHNNARQLRRQLQWKNWSLTIILCSVVAVVVYFIMLASCGGWALKGCFR